MKVLLSNHHLVAREGSELYVRELAGALRDRGHEVGIFTFHPGAVAEQIRSEGVRIFTTADRHELEAFRPDVAHLHHGPCLWYLGSLSLDCPIVFSSLGVIPPHEAPPPVWGGVAFGVSVSEEVRARQAGSPFGQAVPLRVLRNWFDDRGWNRPPAEVPPTPRHRIAVVSNHIPEGLRADLEALSAAGRVTWTHFGLPHRSVQLGPAELAPFDVVVTIGRTALLAAAMGKPCLLYDVHGCDGLMSADRLMDLASVNFSGRLTRSVPSRDELAALLLEASLAVDVGRLQEAVWEAFRLSRRVTEWEALYAEALGSGVRLDDGARELYRPLGELYAGSVAETCVARSRLGELEQEARAVRDLGAQTRRVLEERVAALGADLDVARRAAVVLDVDLAAARRAAAVLDVDLAAARRALSEQQALLEQSRRDHEALKSSVGVSVVRTVQKLPALYPTYLAVKRLVGKR
jgi:hypothetical protein